MHNFARNYRLEFWTVFAAFLTTGVIYLVFELLLQIEKDKLTYAGLANAGLLFVIGNIYGRLKERREALRKRAQELFLEWHSKEIRESRIYVSRWRAANPNKTIPALSEIEQLATRSALEKYAKANAAPISSDQPIHPLSDPEQMELHFFEIYQFFERWSILVKQCDIDRWLADQYMSSYKPWYLEKFIDHWSNVENDPYISKSLTLIVALVGVKSRTDG